MGLVISVYAIVVYVASCVGSNLCLHLDRLVSLSFPVVPFTWVPAVNTQTYTCTPNLGVPIMSSAALIFASN